MSNSSPDTTAPGLLRRPGFVPFLLARLAAMFAQQIQAVVVAWHVYDISGDPMALAWAGLAQFLPMALLVLPAGDMVDRFDRKRILALAWTVHAMCSALLLWLTWSGSDTLPLYYAVLVLFGCARAFTGPALQSVLPQIVPRDELPRAIAANSMIMRIATIGGPVFGGLLYAFGGSLAYAVCLASFIAATALLPYVPIHRAQPMQSADIGAWQRFGAGIAFIRSRPIILGAISLDLFAVLLGGVVALLPIYAQDILKVGPAGLGALRSAMAIGELLMGIYLSHRAIAYRVGRVMFLAVAVFGLANLVFAFSTWFWVSFVALMVAGAADMISVNIRTTLIQLATPDGMRGRVNAVNMLFIGSSNELGEFRTGTSAAWFGAVPAAALGGFATLAVVALWTRLFRPLVQVKRFDDVTCERN